ncbi:MAG: anaerobic sulfatase-maturation protein [Bacteroidaceae bacterium]|nr:anaerobic sulfatase-maturation protein [Bacteroidaceae bacterium]
MVKPVGATCNLDCSYCYYRDKAEIYSAPQNRMTDDVLEEYVRQYLEAVNLPTVTFCWHGGEPLLAGIDFYRKAVELQQRYAAGRQIENTLQTNGTLVNDEWCDFFRENNFLVGVSLDGPEEVHDAYRRDCGGAPTFGKVMQAVEKMHNREVEYNILATVNSRSEGRGKEIYRFLRGISNFIQFLPVVEYVQLREGRRPLIVSPDVEEAVPAPWSVSARGFGEFMCDVFDEWIKCDVGSRFVQLFDITLANWCGVPPSLCAFCETCGDAPVVEYNGDVYSCDHFVYPEYRLGNILSSTLVEMYTSQEQQAFGRDKREALPMECKRCTYNFLCRGECPKHRFATSQRGEPYMNTLCEGYKLFFRHTDPYMRHMKMLLQKERSPMEVMHWARERNKTI